MSYDPNNAGKIIAKPADARTNELQEQRNPVDRPQAGAKLAVMPATQLNSSCQQRWSDAIAYQSGRKPRKDLQ